MLPWYWVEAWVRRLWIKEWTDRTDRLCGLSVFFAPRLLITEDGAVSLLVPAKERYQL